MGVQVLGPAPPGPRASGARLPAPEVPPTPVSFGSSGQRMSGSGLPPARCSARCLGNSRLLITCPIHRCLATHTPRIWLRTSPGGDLCCLLSGVTQEAEQEGAPGTDGGGTDKGSSRHDVCVAACIHTHTDTPVRPRAHTKLCICVCVCVCVCVHLLCARPGGSGPRCLSPAQEGCAWSEERGMPWRGSGGGQG